MLRNKVMHIGSNFIFFALPIYFFRFYFVLLRCLVSNLLVVWVNRMVKKKRKEEGNSNLDRISWLVHDINFTYIILF